MRKIWIELHTTQKPTVYMLMSYENQRVCKDGSISNWLDVNFAMKGHKIIGIGIMKDTIIVEID